MGDGLPEDLIVNIFSRLPVKTLVRFRCACKRWNELIRSPDFVDIHFNANNQNEGARRGSITHHINGGAIFSVRVNEATADLSLPVPDVERAVDVVGSSNGLVCLVVRPWDYALWNPATREFRFLPKPEAKLGGRFNSLGSGFVFDPKSKDYKVAIITVRNDNGRYITQVDVFTLSSNSWKSIRLNLPSEVLRISSVRPVFVNGCSYWIAVLPWEGKNRRHALLCYNIGKENFRALIHLPCDLKDGFQASVKVSGDSLAMFVWTHNFSYPERTWFDVWVLNEHGDGGANYSWSKQLSVGPLEMIALPYRFWVEDGVELVVLHIPDEATGGLNLFTFNPVTRQIKKFQGDCPHDGCTFPHEGCTYFESLIPV
ncbi:putative F-box protein At3g16210 [Diospyros lotus]|uniref:putative F-box protein At3g16210 n=1 Tax=Diospyros lotus TaxID=55363 RepID=UPI0022588552|nr:putative F-box protein At3g16210 [Diospyros lotus]